MSVVTESALKDCLRPFLGAPVIDGTDLCARIYPVFHTWRANRNTLAELAGKLETAIFNELYALLGKQMTVPLANGQYMRIRIQDMDTLSDAAMGALFSCWDISPAHYLALREYAFGSGSLSAMRTLILHYQSLQPQDERSLMIRIIREGYPPEVTEGWLPKE